MGWAEVDRRTLISLNTDNRLLMNAQSLASTPNEAPHLQSWISLRVRINLSRTTSMLTHVPAGPTSGAEAQILWCKMAGTHFRVDIRIGTVGRSAGDNAMTLSRHDKPAGQYLVRVLNEECIPRVDVLFLLDSKDRLRLSFPTLIQLCYPSANIFMLLLATVENGSCGYMEGSKAGWMWARNAYQYSRAWAPKLTPTNTY